MHKHFLKGTNCKALNGIGSKEYLLILFGTYFFENLSENIKITTIFDDTANVNWIHNARVNL